ncbi:hypothetical protein ABEB36_009443 [Hypothenemus hampei]|uniref:CCHC-type domain-containing protein n=1 Tax=Hypothenemus hampei TaxID=57062 RepID=A0ABD1EGD7_HYPHA
MSRQDLEQDSITAEIVEEEMVSGGLTPTDRMMERLFSLVIAQNRKRDEVMEKLIRESRNSSEYRGNAYHIMPDLTSNIGKFDGNQGGEIWLKKLQSMEVLHHWPDSFTLETARTNLVGGAAQRTFVREEDLPTKWRKMADKVQGLYDRQMYSVMLAKNHYDGDELLHNLLEYEQIEKARLEKLWPGKESNPRSQTLPGPNKRDAQGENVRSRSHAQAGERLPERDNDNVRAYCKAEIDPPKTRSCYKCGKEGHYAKDCPTSQNLTTKGQQLILQLGGMEATSKYFKEVKLSDPVQATIDPGSAVCAIKESLANRLSLPRKTCEENLYGFGSDKPLLSIAKVRVLLQVDEVLESVEMLVVPEDA